MKSSEEEYLKGLLSNMDKHCEEWIQMMYRNNAAISKITDLTFDWDVDGYTEFTNPNNGDLDDSMVDKEFDDIDLSESDKDSSLRD